MDLRKGLKIQIDNEPWVIRRYDDEFKVDWHTVRAATHVVSPLAVAPRVPRDGRFIEQIGTYDPSRPITEATVDYPRLDYWVGVGAQVSDRVRDVVKEHKKAAAAAAPHRSSRKRTSRKPSPKPIRTMRRDMKPMPKPLWPGWIH